ncbi:MAG: FHA domain-containing protein [Fuerstiella sp.]
MTISGHVFPNDAVGYFRIASPSRRQPVEPVTVGTFLLGSGAACHLRFGSDQIPEIHTELTVEPGRVMMSAKAAYPPVYVNGTAETECRLYDGDLLELGPERLLFRFSAAEQRITLNETQFLADLAAQANDQDSRQMPTSDDSSDIASPTIETLVERLEEQVSLVEQLTHDDQDGLAELIRSVAASSERQSSSSVNVSLQELAITVAENQQSNRLRLDSMTEVLNKVVQQQKLIADSLQSLSDRVLAFDSNQTPAAADFTNRKAS